MPSWPNTAQNAFPENPAGAAGGCRGGAPFATGAEWNSDGTTIAPVTASRTIAVVPAPRPHRRRRRDDSSGGRPPSGSTSVGDPRATPWGTVGTAAGGRATGGGGGAGASPTGAVPPEAARDPSEPSRANRSAARTAPALS